MKPIKQLFRHDPSNGIYGDCHRTCIAMLMGLEAHEVPHFQREVTGVEQNQFFRDWLGERGLALGYFSFYRATMDWVKLAMETWNPGMACIVSGTSPRGTCHSVVLAPDGQIHDPHPDGGDLVGPDDDENFTIYVLVKL